MKKLILITLLSAIVIFGFSHFENERRGFNTVYLDVNNLKSQFFTTGIFNQGVEWPKGTGKSVCFTSGLTIASKINGQYAMSSASYTGEYVPGCIINGVFTTNSNFRIYKVTKGDNSSTNPDWANWGLMVPYGAPWTDKNNNGTYEPAIDTPGVRGASQTIFVCMTDADVSQHRPGEGFGGGITTPLMVSELHLTAWAYTKNSIKDVQFLKWDIINKSPNTWDSMLVTLVNDPDLGEALDDYIGCDTIRDMAYCYNANPVDQIYGNAPPAFGMMLLNGLVNKNVIPNVLLGMTSSVYFTNSGSSPPPCESDPNGEPIPAYNMMKGFKKDLTWWLNPLVTQGTKKTKFCYTGSPETNTGWTETKGSIQNCGGDTTGIYIGANVPGDRRFTISSGPYTFHPNDTQRIVIAQMVARGITNRNSVGDLRALADTVRAIYNGGFNVGINPVSTVVPNQFALNQNYPNPFNPATKIKFDIPRWRGVGGWTSLKIFDITGREIETLVNEMLQPGIYEVTFDGSNLTSGVYFYQIVSSGFTETRRMLLIK
jgi:hypothetical protein